MTQTETDRTPGVATSDRQGQPTSFGKFGERASGFVKALRAAAAAGGVLVVAGNSAEGVLEQGDGSPDEGSRHPVARRTFRERLDGLRAPVVEARSGQTAQTEAHGTPPDGSAFGFERHREVLKERLEAARAAGGQGERSNDTAARGGVALAAPDPASTTLPPHVSQYPYVAVATFGMLPTDLNYADSHISYGADTFDGTFRKFNGTVFNGLPNEGSLFVESVASVLRLGNGPASDTSVVHYIALDRNNDAWRNAQTNPEGILVSGRMGIPNANGTLFTYEHLQTDPRGQTIVLKASMPCLAIPLNGTLCAGGGVVENNNILYNSNLAASTKTDAKGCIPARPTSTGISTNFTDPFTGKPITAVWVQVSGYVGFNTPEGAAAYDTYMDSLGQTATWVKDPRIAPTPEVTLSYARGLHPDSGEECLAVTVKKLDPPFVAQLGYRETVDGPIIPIASSSLRITENRGDPTNPQDLGSYTYHVPFGHFGPQAFFAGSADNSLLRGAEVPGGN